MVSQVTAVRKIEYDFWIWKSTKIVCCCSKISFFQLRRRQALKLHLLHNLQNPLLGKTWWSSFPQKELLAPTDRSSLPYNPFSWPHSSFFLTQKDLNGQMYFWERMHHKWKVNVRWENINIQMQRQIHPKWQVNVRWENILFANKETSWFDIHEGVWVSGLIKWRILWHGWVLSCMTLKRWIGDSDWKLLQNIHSQLTIGLVLFRIFPFLWIILWFNVALMYLMWGGGG